MRKEELSKTLQSPQHLSVIRFAPKLPKASESNQEKQLSNPERSVLCCINCPTSLPDNNNIIDASHPISNQITSACVVCGLQVSQEDYGEHIITHVEAQGNSMRCAYCGKGFTGKTVLLVHYRKHIAQFLCVDCKQPFMQVGDLKQHVLVTHGHPEKNPYHCYVCMSRFTHQEAIVNHMTLHTGEIPYRCKECGCSFIQLDNLRRHLNNHRPHSCDRCDARFADSTTLRNHLRTHTGETPYVCQICNRRFSQVGNLKRHMTKHLETSKLDDVRPYLCTRCNQGFAHESTLRNHRRIHTGEQPYKCHLCPRAFSQIGNLKRHMAKHATSSSETLNQTQIPWTTSSSNGSISVIDDVKMMKIRSGRVVKRKWRVFPCPDCGKVYAWLHDLNIHYRIHSGEKPYQCDSCGKKFAQSGAVRTHKRRYHPTNEVSISEIRK